MAFRVTNTQTTAKFIRQIFQTRESLNQQQQKIATGFDITKPSQDPGRAATIAQFQSTVERLQRHKDRIATTTAFLESQDGALESAENVIIRAKELATQGANETLSMEERGLIAEEVAQLRDQFVALSNTQYQGRYIFGGNADDQPPYTLTGAYADPIAGAPDPAALGVSAAFTNNPGVFDTRDITISDDVDVRVNTNATLVFSNGIYALERLGRALAGYNTFPEAPLPAALASPPAGGTLPNTGNANNDSYVALGLADPHSEQTNDIRATIDIFNYVQTNEIVAERASIGARMNQVFQAEEVINIVKFNTESAKSSLQDADPFEAASNLQQLQTSLEGLLASGSRLNQLSLLNFI